MPLGQGGGGAGGAGTKLVFFHYDCTHLSFDNLSLPLQFFLGLSPSWPFSKGSFWSRNWNLVLVNLYCLVRQYSIFLNCPFVARASSFCSTSVGAILFRKSATGCFGSENAHIRYKSTLHFVNLINFLNK